MKRASIFVIAALLIMPTAAVAQIIPGGCALLTPNDGTISLGGDLRTWSTTVPATIGALTTARSTLIITKPNDWASAPAGVPPTNFTAQGTLSGVNLGSLLGGGGTLTAPLSALGLTTASIAIGATATAPFRAGAYAAQVTVTCTTP